MYQYKWNIWINIDQTILINIQTMRFAVNTSGHFSLLIGFVKSMMFLFPT